MERLREIPRETTVKGATAPMKNQTYFVVYSPDEIAIVIQSLNRLRNALIRENRDSGCVDELLLKVMCAPVKKI